MIEKRTQNNPGFALLLTLVVVSVILAIGLSLLDITLKQLVLSGTARDSEIAFHAAYAGLECAEYWVRDDYTAFIGSAPELSQCTEGSVTGSASVPVTDVHLSVYQFTWGASGEERCTNMEIFLFDADGAGSDVSYPFETLGYGYDNETCAAGSVCTYVFSRGYNRACDDTSTLRTVQREVVSKF